MPGLLDRISKLTRRALTGHPSAASPESHLAWLEEQVRAYATLQPYSGPTTSIDNLTGETWEIREAHRKAAFLEPAVSSALRAAVHAVCSLDVQVIPEDKSVPDHKDAAAWVDWSVSNSAGGWPQLLWSVAFMGLVDGYSVTEKVWDTVPGDHPKYAGRWTLKAAKSKDTKFIRYRLDTFKNVVAVQSMSAGQGGQPLDPGDFILFTHLKIFESPFGVSALRPVNRAANLIAAAVKLRSILLENFSGPFLVVKSQDSASRELLAKRVLKDARARGFLVLNESDTFEVVNLATSAPDQFQQSIEDLRKEIYLAIRGAYLQALESNTDQGSSETHRGQADLFEWWLATTLAGCVTEQLVPDLVTPHYGSRGGRPKVVLGGVDPNEVLKNADRIERAQQIGLKVSAGYATEMLQVEPPRDETDVLTPPASARPAGAPGDPFGLAAPPRPPALPPARPFADPPAGGSGHLPEPGQGHPLDPLGGAILEALGIDPAAPKEFAAPGPPPRPGLVWKEATHRWVTPDGDDPGDAPHAAAAAQHPRVVEAAKRLTAKAGQLAAAVNAALVARDLTPEALVGNEQSWSLYFATAHTDLLVQHLHLDTQTAFAVLSHLAAHAIGLVRRHLAARAAG